MNRDRWRKRANRTAARILECFSRHLAGGGFEQVTVARIAEELGIVRSTVYRAYANANDMAWALAVPIFDAALKHALRGDQEGFEKTFGEIWSVPGLVAALNHPKTACAAQAKLCVLAAAQVERRTRTRDTETCGLLIAASVMALLQRYRAEPPPASATGEVMSLIYIAAYLTPQGLRSLARDRAKHADGGSFQPAVSIRESLESPDYILSMIDGKPYKSLHRHLARFGMSPDEYRRSFGLPQDYPMVAKAMSERMRRHAEQRFSRTRADPRTSLPSARARPEQQAAVA